MDSEKINSTPVPAYDQHPSPAAHQPQAAPIVPVSQDAHMQSPATLPKDYPQAQPLPQPPAPGYYATAPGVGHPSGYNSATPLHALQRGPTPVDCPVCGQREMTRVEAHAGNTTHSASAPLPGNSTNLAPAYARGCPYPCAYAWDISASASSRLFGTM
ncbi:hypothetical protein CNMCM8689_001556 [Aspergillus fumigatus]|nr:hypothetical protein CNMCM8057_000931 [Aspergillus fumigatus]KAF4280731.1 hypothetical protein CNMCM8689_001556 [Aspergillus fumigatus]